MNAPEHETMEELAEIALDKDHKQRYRWKREANAIKHGSIGEHSRASSTKRKNGLTQ